MAAKALLETAVLAPHDPTLTNSDDWPEFQLTNVEVTHPSDPSTLVSLLQSSEQYPLQVTGKLESLSKTRSHLYAQSSVNVNYKNTAIQISEVRSYAYGQYADGNVDLWAAGKAGWFTLKPSRAYRPIYDNMIAGIKALYFVADSYRETRYGGRRKKGNAALNHPPQACFSEYGSELGIGALKAEELIYQHRDFLIKSMLEGKEGLNWTRNPLSLHMCAKFPQDLQAIKARLAGLSGNKNAHIKASVEPSPAPSSTASSGTKRKRGRPRKNSMEVGANYEVVSLSSCSTVSSVPKPAPIKKTTQADTKTSKTRKASASTSLTSSAAASQTPDAIPTVSTPVQDSEDENPRRAHKGKSALRPKPSKGTAGKGKTLALNPAEDGSNSAPSPSAGKRKSIEDAEQRHAKRRNSKPQALHVDEGIDMPSSPSDSASDSLDEAATIELAVRTKHEPDPVQEDTWVCALDGCSHKVYLASEPTSQALIKEHYAMHAYDDDPRVQFVRKMQAPSLPVNRLMDKVRAQAKLEGFPGSAGGMAVSRYPPAIVQRY